MTNPNDINNVYETSSTQTTQSAQSSQHGQNVPPPIHIQLPPQRSFGCGMFFLQFFIGIAIFFGCGFLLIIALAIIGATMSEQIEELSHKETLLKEKFVKGNSKAKNKVAILTISGIIRSEEDGFVAKQIRQITNDVNVKAVVLRVDSPGGTISGSDYYLYLLKKMKVERSLPIIVSMGAIAASGGYYVSTAGDEIYAEPTTATGSIGVIVPLFNAASLCQKIGFESTPITSGPLKNMGDFTKPLSEEERKIWQNLVDESFKQFKSVIIDGRKNFEENPDSLDKIATGQVYTAKEAKNNGLIDEIGYIDDAITKAIDLSGINELDLKVIKYKAKSSFVDVILESKSELNPLNAEAISDFTTPKVYLIMPNVLPVK
ncbi:MAG: signal peptide peptidase SppA [Planctomycetaceae bacterium]|jgi:protease-4|nr:signal peptide peptidase SppA [Planctomycetaceae bacterium]